MRTLALFDPAALDAAGWTAADGGDQAWINRRVRELRVPFAVPTLSWRLPHAMR